MQCSLVFRQLSRTYASDNAKIAYMIELFRDQALRWGQAVLNTRPGITYDEFVSKFKSVFLKGTDTDTAAHRLFSLQQGKRSVADYSVEFWILAEEAGWEEKALRAAFLNGLTENLKGELAAKDLPVSLDDLISMCIRIDDHIREYKRPKHFAPRETLGGAGSLERFREAGESGPTYPEPMQLGRAHLSPTERLKRRTAGECFYCGIKGHFIDSCPQKPKDRARQ